MSEPLDSAPPNDVSEPPLDASREAAPTPSFPPGERPTFVFFGVVAAISLLLDIASKAWAEIQLTVRPSIVLIPDHLSFVLAYNKGGAWGLLQDKSELVRLPFFLAVSVLAILFIVSLFGKLAPGQTALKWGLPLVLGGALGNLSDRITRSSVIDFIDYRADWVLAMNHGIAKLVKGWNLTDHWPTFNVADISICIGVGLMAVDMFTSRRAHAHPQPAPTPPPPAAPERPVTSPSEPPAA
jgi:signal peptidase II